MMQRLEDRVAMTDAIVEGEVIRAGAPDDDAVLVRPAAFDIGEIVRHRHFAFRGVIFDVDPEFANSDEWYEAIPEAIRPHKDQPFYHLLAENEEAAYVAYVSQQNLLRDDAPLEIGHPALAEMFSGFEGGRYLLKTQHLN